MIAGRNPYAGKGGHDSYVRAHALAARGAGFVPHLFGMGERRQTVESETGVIHDLPVSGLRPRNVNAPVYARVLAREVRRVLCDDVLRERLGAQARQVFASRFAPARMVREFSELYREFGARPADVGFNGHRSSGSPAC